MYDDLYHTQERKCYGSNECPCVPAADGVHRLFCCQDRVDQRSCRRWLCPAFVQYLLPGYDSGNLCHGGCQRSAGYGSAGAGGYRHRDPCGVCPVPAPLPETARRSAGAADPHDHRGQCDLCGHPHVQRVSGSRSGDGGGDQLLRPGPHCLGYQPSHDAQKQKRQQQFRQRGAGKPLPGGNCRGYRHCCSGNQNSGLSAGNRVQDRGYHNAYCAAAGGYADQAVRHVLLDP